jgi:hypothetical protein
MEIAKPRIDPEDARVGRFGTLFQRVIALGALVLVVMATLVWPVAALAAPTATVTGSFGDSCRDFEAASSKDISHAEIIYADGRVAKDENLNSPDFFSIDGDAGDEIDLVIVKSGTTREEFGCASAPVSACSDGEDNDGDSLIDYPDDPNCPSADGTDEALDNDDGFD